MTCLPRGAALVALLAGALVGPAGAAPPTGGDCAPPGDGLMRVDRADLVLHDDAGAVRARWPLRDAGGRPGVPIAVCRLQQRQSFVVVLAGWHELWEISTDPTAPPIFDGLVHDWRLGEGIGRPGHLGVRRIRLQRPWVAVWADGRVPWLLGAEASDHPLGTGGSAGTLQVVVLNLDIRRTVGRWPLAPAMPPGAPDVGFGHPLEGTSLQPADPGGGWNLRLPASAGPWRLLDGRRWQPLCEVATGCAPAADSMDTHLRR